MSDPRFARLKSDPRFRRVRKKEDKVVVDERFKNVFDQGTGSGKKKDKKGKGRVDKYGRPLSDTHEQDSLRRFYRFEDEGQEAKEEGGEASVKVPDYARGEVLLESSDEEEDEESDTGGVVTLGANVSKPIHVLDDTDEPEIDLDEDNFADLDAQAAEYAKAHEAEDEDEDEPDVNRTRRFAVVNLDWDHVRATHLYKIFSSLVSATASAVPSTSASKAKADKKGKGAWKGAASRVVRGRVLSVRVYPSEFGKERLKKEETEGPPRELFTKSAKDEDEDDLTVRQTADGEDYNEDALRKYQLDRLRYYYAVVECDSVETASHLYDELEGTELERSANVFDLSFIPDDMTFDDQFRDEATEDVSGTYKPLDYTTDALRHSKVKLSWDEDDPERDRITRRTLTRQEIEENDFKAYLASDTESESDGDEGKKKMDREKLRALLLSGGDDTLPEGWGAGFDDDAHDVDMEITFAPGLSTTKGGENETTLEKYQRKMKEKKKKRKEEVKEKVKEKDTKEKKIDAPKDDFFADGSDDEDEDDGAQEDREELPVKNAKRDKKTKAKAQTEHEDSPEPERHAATTEELTLLAVSDNPNGELKHFDMKAVLKAEKAKGKKHKHRKDKKKTEEGNDLQEDFAIDVKDERFQAVLEDHTFAIDPSNPQFKKTKSMSALLDERSKRQKKSHGKKQDGAVSAKTAEADSSSSLKNLVESVKRKSIAADGKGVGKRRKL